MRALPFGWRLHAHVHILVLVLVLEDGRRLVGQGREARVVGKDQIQRAELMSACSWRMHRRLVLLLVQMLWIDNR